MMWQYDEFIHEIKNMGFDENLEVGLAPLDEDCAWALVLLRPYQLVVLPARRGYGRLAAIGGTIDYHTALYAHLNLVGDFLRRNFICVSEKAYVDKDGGDDRKIAYSAGLGFYGRHNLLIHESLGSAFNIGYIPFNTTQAQSDMWHKMKAPIKINSCGTCKRCISACPTKALSEDLEKGLDSSRCRSAINQRSGTLSEEELAFMGDYLYGCDICQLACPYNSGRISQSPELVEPLYLELAELIDHSNRSFKEKYGPRAFSYLGAGRMRRNARHIQNGQSCL